MLYLEISYLEHLLVANNKIEGWEFLKTLMDSKTGKQLLGFRVSGNLFYDHPAARQVLIACFPALTILNGAPVDKPSLKINAQRYCASSRDVERLQFISSTRLAELRNVNAASAAEPEPGTVDEVARRKSGISVRVFPLEGKNGKIIELTV